MGLFFCNRIQIERLIPNHSSIQIYIWINFNCLIFKFEILHL
jgi:hypothetical protein